MEEEVIENPEVLTLENIGKGLAFLGMIVFLLTVLFYFLSRGQPEQFHLFAEFSHVIIMSIIALVFVIVGYALTKIKPKSTD